MPYADLREFLAALEEKGQIAHVTRPVALAYELGAVAYTNAQRAGPALMFENPRPGTVPIAVDILGGWDRYALGLQVPVDRLHEEWNRRTANPVPPRTVKTGPCKENILLGEACDVTKFSIPTWNEADGGPYIDFPIVITRDPDTGIRNAAIYRLQVHGPRELGILAENYRHLNMHRRKFGNKPFPVVIALGTDPTLPMAAVGAFAFGVDELAMAGGLRQAPVEVVACETIPLDVPATSEIVIEGEIYPDDMKEEGPFGEFTGYYGPPARRPVIRIKAITHRNNPIHVGYYTGRVAQEAVALSVVPIESEILRQVPLPHITKLIITPASRGFTCIASVRKPFEGYGMMVGMSILGTWPARRVKVVIVVDDDCDPANWHDVDWAISTRVQPHRDIAIIPSVTGVVLDPSIKERGGGEAVTSKMIIDATRSGAKDYPKVCLPKLSVLAEVERDWDSYGISAVGKTRKPSGAR